jgi:hypothetical protein
VPSYYLACRLFDRSGSYTVFYLVGIALLLGAAVPLCHSERRYSSNTLRQSVAGRASLPRYKDIGVALDPLQRAHLCCPIAPSYRHQ